MKVIVVLEINPDEIIESGDPKEEGLTISRCVEDIIEASCGHLGVEGVLEFFEASNIPSNDADLGAELRKNLHN